VPGIYDVQTYVRRDDFVAKLDQLVNYATTANLFIVLSFRTGPGRGEGNITGDGLNNSELFTSVSAQNAYEQMWKDVAFKYKDNTNVIAYDLLVEPHDITTATWSSLAQKLINGIRTIDAEKPIVISLPDWGNYAQLSTWMPLSGNNLVYAIHQYDPYEYTHENKASNEMNALNGIYQSIADWMNVHHRPIFINEVGLANKVTNGTSFMADQLSKIEALGINHAAWIWEVGFDPDYDYAEFDFKKHGGLMSVYQNTWSTNSIYPEGATPTLPPVLPAVFAYPCGRAESFNNGFLKARLYVSRDCATGELELMNTGVLFRNTHSGQITSVKEPITFLRAVDIDGADAVTQINSNRVDYSLSLGRFEEKAIQLSAVSAGAQTCLKLQAPEKLTVRFGPNNIEKKMKAGMKINLATMNDCP
jgi:hypothetical protein